MTVTIKSTSPAQTSAADTCATPSKPTAAREPSQPRTRMTGVRVALKPAPFEFAKPKSRGMAPRSTGTPAAAASPTPSPPAAPMCSDMVSATQAMQVMQAMQAMQHQQQHQAMAMQTFEQQNKANDMVTNAVKEQAEQTRKGVGQAGEAGHKAV